MSDSDPLAAAQRIGVIDLGSNSLRLVVFERLGAALFPLFNEKVMCGLGRGIASTGRLNPEGVTLALINLRRFVAFARAIAVDHLAVLATAAVRDASDGRAFAAEVERQCRVQVKIINGAEEARLSAAGVLAGIRDADGIVADLGGGSVELVLVGPSAMRAESGRVGGGISLPLGPLRLAEFADRTKSLTETVERTLAGASVLRAAAGKKLYLVGGAARAIARLHMDHMQYPLHIIHRYTISRRDPRYHRSAVSQIARADNHNLAQASLRGAARRTGSAQADHSRRTTKRRLFRSWAAGGLCLRADLRRGPDIGPDDRRLYGRRPSPEPVSVGR